MSAPDREKYPKEYEAFCRKSSELRKKEWANSEYVEKQKKSHKNVWTAEMKKKQSKSKKKLWKNSKIRKKIIAASVEGLKRPEVRRKKSEVIKKSNYSGFMKERKKEWRPKCILYGGRYCRKCELDLLDSRIKVRPEFHHIYLRNRDNFSILVVCGCDNRSWDEYKKEMDKCLLLCGRCSTSIHWRSYDYLVEICKFKEYVDWYLKTYKPKIFDGYIGGKVIIKHHMDENKKNNNKENLLFLKRADHMLLHLTSYKYLIEIGEIDNYIEWFLNPKRKMLRWENKLKNIKKRR